MLRIDEFINKNLGYIIAKLEWTCRVMICCAISINRSGSQGWGQRRSQSWSQRRSWSQKDGQISVDTFVKTLYPMYPAAAIVYGNGNLPQITWLDETHLRSSIHGKTLGLNQGLGLVKKRLDVRSWTARRMDSRRA